MNNYRIGFFGLLLGCSCLIGSLPEKFIWKRESIKVDIDTGGWAFFTGAEGEIGFPTDAFLKVFAEKDERVIKIGSPEDIKLLNGVPLGTERQALGWVQFFTRRDLFRYFDAPRAIEIDVDDLKVTRSNDGFIIERTLAFEPPALENQVPIYRVREKVFSAGRYSMLEKKFIENRSRQELQMPVRG